MSRISREEYLMLEAWNASRRSTCLRLQVGAVLARDGRVVVSGYNGAPKGQPHCDPSVCGPDVPCLRTVHAEVNCIYFAARHGILVEGTTMFTTDSPCQRCAEAIVNAGVHSVFFNRAYRDTAPIEFLSKAKIIVIQYDPI